MEREREMGIRLKENDTIELYSIVHSLYVQCVGVSNRVYSLIV